jgi:site-specific recombinase XerD
MARFGSWVLDERKFLSFEELARLRRHVRRRLDRNQFKKRLPWLDWFLVELALETGLRVAEMAALTCSDLVVGVERCGVMVRRGKCGRSRFVRIRPSFTQACQDFLRWKAATGEPVEKEAPVFLSSRTGRGMSTRGLQKMFLRCCRRVNIAGHSVHHCRHTYASHLYKASGHDLRMVQRQLGHSSVKTTEVYAHVFDQDIDRAVGRLYGERHCALVGK